MKQNEADKLAYNLAARFGLPMKAVINPGSNGQEVYLEPDDIHPHDGFRVHIHLGWRSLTINLEPGKFAADLVQEMGHSGMENRQIFANIARHVMKEKGALTFLINGTGVDPLNPQTWPDGWKRLVFTLKKSPLEINTEDHRLTEGLINTWVERFYGCIIALSPLEETESDSGIKGLPEGAISKQLVNRYERSRYNRAMCINFHGSNCKICNMSFGASYGDIGEGFIHVHHIIPVSKLGGDYIINPVDDLIPVCPNCHVMLHRRDPAYSVEELRKIINNAS